MNLTILLHNERLIHSLKTALACVIGFLIGSSFNFQAYQWIIITILVVMCGQVNVGSMIQKSYMRLIGTLAGSVIALSTLYFFGNNYEINLLVIIAATLLFSFIATSSKAYSESGTLGAVTVTIVLIAQNATLQSGIERCVEIFLGIIIAALVSQFIFPIHAQNHLRRNQATTIRKLRTFYKTVFSNRLSVKEMGELRNLDEDIAKSLIAQRKLASEAKREPIGTAFNLANFQQSLWFEKEILRSVIFMYRAYHASLDTKKFLRDIDQFQKFNEGVCQSLDKIALCIEKKRIDTILVPNIAPLKEAISVKISALSLEQKIYVDSFLFAAELLVGRLNKLIGLVNPL